MSSFHQYSGELVGGMLKIDDTSFSSIIFDDKWLVAGANGGTIRGERTECRILSLTQEQCGTWRKTFSCISFVSVARTQK